MALRDQKERLDRETVFLKAIFTGSAHARSPAFQSVLSVYALRVSKSAIPVRAHRAPHSAGSAYIYRVFPPDYTAKVENNEEKIQQKQEK